MKIEPEDFCVSVIGDLVIDWLVCKLPRGGKDFDPILAEPLSGGAWFVADAVRAALEATPDLRFHLASYHTRKGFATSWNSPITQSIWNVDIYPKEIGEKNLVFRLRHLNGYDRPNPKLDMSIFPFNCQHNQDHTEMARKTSDDAYDVVIIDDMNLGFRDDARRKDWEVPLSRLKKGVGIVVLILSGNDLPREGQPLPPLWEHLQEKYNDRTVSIISANSLRKAGAIISRRISWEDTAEGFIENVESVGSIRGFANLLVRFGFTGAIHYRRKPEPEICDLYFDPLATDGVFRDREREGNIIGGNSIFAAWIARSAAELMVNPSQSMSERIKLLIDRAGRLMIRSAQKFYRYGYGFYNLSETGVEQSISGLRYEGMYSAFVKSGCFGFKEGQDEKLWQTPKTKVTLRTVTPMNILMSAQPDPMTLEGDVTSGIGAFALNIVMHGVNMSIKKARLGVPIAQFGSIVALDRETIESYRQLESRLRDYLADPSKQKPLNIAVFGAPGAGKSFTVRQIAASVDPRIKMLTCNLTQMGHDSEFLIREFINVLDENRSGKMPLMMFDEFDCDGFAHLKDFLAPMEDGTFLFRGQSLHLGRCIFVFAGGLCTSYDEFIVRLGRSENTTKKGSDFASRLLGHINLLGLNQSGKKEGNAYIVRRAILLRSFLQGLAIIEGDARGDTKDGDARIDKDIIAAMLGVREFHHGARSMRAILNMFRKDGGRIDKAGIPPEPYLKMHIVDYWNFYRILNRLPLIDSQPPYDEGGGI